MTLIIGLFAYFVTITIAQLALGVSNWFLLLGAGFVASLWAQIRYNRYFTRRKRT